MSGEDDQSPGDKPYEPTQKKLEEARRRGERPRFVDLTTAASYAGLLLAGVALGSQSIGSAAGAMAGLLAGADRLAEAAPNGRGDALLWPLWSALAGPLAIWFGLPALAAFLALAAQRGLAFAPDRLEPKLSRISPLATARQKFGADGLFEFAKSAAKLTVFTILLLALLSAEMERILLTVRLPPAQAVIALGALLVKFMALAVAATALIGVADALWQHASHLRQNRMTRKELADEQRESEGDPNFRFARRQRAQELAMNRMLDDVPGADVVVVNPSHYAVALKWSRLPGSAPVCVAKGVDEIAARIRERAAEAGVPIHRDPPTARALFATVEIGNEVQPEQYRAVAAAIRFAERMRQAARGARP